MVTKSDLLLQALKDTQKNPWPTTAICTNVRGRLKKLPQYQWNISQKWDDMLLHLFQKWPKYSGDPLYPVPSVTLGLAAFEQFNVIVDGQVSFWEGEYGELRKELLEFCILQLENSPND